MTTTNQQRPLRTILTIAGAYRSSGAGIQADLKTIHALGGYALTAITAITAQNSQGVQQVYPVSAQQLRDQLTSLFNDYEIDAIKIGMLGNAELINVVAAELQQHQHIPVILDPIILSSNGKNLLSNKAVAYFVKELLPLAEIVTPNLPELNSLLNCHLKGQADEMPKLLNLLKENAWPNTLMKGGHSAESLAIDYLLLTQPTTTNLTEDIYAFPAARIHTQNSHGTGCTLSSAIATQLAFKHSITDAVKLAKIYLHNALNTANYGQPKYKQIIDLNHIRHGGLNHFGQSAYNAQEEEE